MCLIEALTNSALPHLLRFSASSVQVHSTQHVGTCVHQRTNFIYGIVLIFCRWGYIEGRTHRSAKVAAIVAVVLSFFSIFWAMILKKKLQLRAEAEAARIKALEAEEASDSLELRIPSAFQSYATAGALMHP